jgi:ATP-dependent DNA helicase RecG
MSIFTDERLQAIVPALRELTGETEIVEFKSNHLAPQEIGEYISALSNSAALLGKPHAFLVFGIEDSTHNLIGTTFKFSGKGKGNEDLVPWLNRLLEPSTHFEFHEISHQGKRLVILAIQGASTSPVAFNGNRLIRVGSYRKNLAEQVELERQLWAAFDATPYELRPASDVVDEERLFDLLAYEAYFTLAQTNVPSTTDEILEHLEAAGFISRADVTGWHITNMGALLLAKELHQFPSIERKATRVILYKGANKAAPAEEQLGKRGYAVRFSRLLNYVEDRTPQSETFPDGIRRVAHPIPKKVLRELIANALIHQDLAVTGSGPIVEIFDDRIEVSNPGESLIAPVHLVEGTARSRNEKLAKQMRQMGICDERGSGWVQIAEFIEQSGLPAPNIDSSNGVMRVVVYWARPLDSLSKDEALNLLLFHAAYLNSRGEHVTNASLRKRFGLSEKDNSKVSRLLRDGIDGGLIKIFDPSVGVKARSYVPDWAAGH